MMNIKNDISLLSHKQARTILEKESENRKHRVQFRSKDYFLEVLWICYKLDTV